MMKQGLIIILVMLLAACTLAETATPENDDSVDLSDIATPTREGDAGEDIQGDPGSGFGLGDDATSESGFSAALDGAVTATLTGIGTINCENDVYVIRADMSSFPQVTLILPEGASTGFYNLTDNAGDGTTASASIFLEDGRVFASDIDGVLVIDALATAPNQPVTGSFDFSASNGSTVVNARGEFDFVSGEDAFYCE